MRRGFLFLLFLLAAPSRMWGETIYALSGGWRLIWFDSETPGTLIGSLPITGDLGGYLGMTIEFDPQTRELYAFAYPNCEILCPTSPVHPGRIDLATGESSLLDWPGFPSDQLSLYDFDIHPVTREVRMIQYALTNYRYSLNALELHVDQPLDTPGRYQALAHAPPGGAHGGETLAIYYPPVYPLVPHLARIGGVAGNPPASAGEVTVLGPIDIPHLVRGFDISAGGGGLSAGGARRFRGPAALSAEPRDPHDRGPRRHCDATPRVRLRPRDRCRADGAGPRHRRGSGSLPHWARGPGDAVGDSGGLAGTTPGLISRLRTKARRRVSSLANVSNVTPALRLTR
jgi:hypothetical protein